MKIKCEDCGKVANQIPTMARWCVRCLESQIDRLWVFEKPYTDAVYGLYDESGGLLYIGVTNNPVRRLHEHKEAKEFSRMRVVSVFTSRAEADDFEKFSIYHRRPPLNIKRDRDWATIGATWESDLKWFGRLPDISVKSGKVTRLPTAHRGAMLYSKGKAKKKREFGHTPIPCARCGSTVGKKRKVVDGKVFHDRDCQAPQQISEEEKQRQAEERKAREEAKRAKKAAKKRESECFLCKKKANARDRVLVKDKAGRKAFMHKVCLKEHQDRRLAAQQSDIN